MLSTRVNRAATVPRPRADSIYSLCHLPHLQALPDLALLGLPPLPLSAAAPAAALEDGEDEFLGGDSGEIEEPRALPENGPTDDILLAPLPPPLDVPPGSDQQPAPGADGPDAGQLEVIEDEFAGEEAPGEVPPPPDPFEPLEDEFAGGAAVDDGGEGGAVGRGPIGDSVVPPTILGIPCRIEWHMYKGTAGLRILCNRHVNCAKYRSLKLWEEQLGPSAASQYLATWLAAGPLMEREDHSLFRPTLAQVRAFVRDHPDIL
jgi:hypothetical protein